MSCVGLLWQFRVEEGRKLVGDMSQVVREPGSQGARERKNVWFALILTNLPGF